LHAFSAVALLTFGATVLAQPPQWDLVWSDDFNVFDGNTWIRETTFNPTNNSLHAYLPQQVTVSNGNLVITSEDESAGDLPYRSGLVKSRAAQQFGRWEVRAKLPTSQGMWPAIWLLPDTGQHPWPSEGEIDIMENRGNQPTLTSSAFHYGTNPPFSHQFTFNEQRTSRFGSFESYPDDFHTYAAEWTANHIRFFVDDVHHFTVYDADVGGFLSQQSAPMQLIINTAIGGHFLPNPDESTVWPQQFLVDWVRVYEPANAPAQLTLRNAAFEENSGSLAGWSVFGNTTSANVSVDNEAVMNGEASLKLYGQFNGQENYSGVSQGITVSPGDEVQADASIFVRSQDSISGTANSLLMKVEFYDEFGAEFGTSSLLGVEEITAADGSTANNLWHDRELSALAPAGATEARLAFVFRQPGVAAGAVHVDDVHFSIVPAALPGDYNQNGVVDASDYVLWRKTVGDEGPNLPADGDGNEVVDDDDLEFWRERFGNESNGGGGGIAVPEPSGMGWLIVAAFGIACSRTRQSQSAARRRRLHARIERPGVLV
jgi:beta-glucanase (GH16 family)